MTCDPGEHDFVNESSYSIEIETDSAIVEQLEEEKRCRHCGKTPEETNDYVSESSDSDGTTPETQTNDPETTAQTETSDEISPEDDAVIMTTDNSESQAQTGGQQTRNTQSQTDEDNPIQSGDQTDDAYVMDSSDTLQSSDVDDSLEDQWEGEGNVFSGPLLECETCGFEVPQEKAPQYPGDSCPECQSDYLQERDL